MTEYIPDNEAKLYSKLFSMISSSNEEPSPVIFDVGANIGQSIELFRKNIPNCLIHSFEPSPEAFSELSERWGREKGITLNQFALSEQGGVHKFYATETSVASSLLPPDPKLTSLSKDDKYNYKLMDVACETLDNYCQLHKIDHVDILKLDVQGTELSVLKGAKKLLDNSRVRFIFLEAIFAETYIHQWRLKDMLNLTESYGYILWDFLPSCYSRSGRLWYGNMIFVSDKETLKLEGLSRA